VHSREKVAARRFGVEITLGRNRLETQPRSTAYCGHVPGESQELESSCILKRIYPMLWPYLMPPLKFGAYERDTRASKMNAVWN
jgi:hypothetical protein